MLVGPMAIKTTTNDNNVTPAPSPPVATFRSHFLDPSLQALLLVTLSCPVVPET